MREQMIMAAIPQLRVVLQEIRRVLDHASGHPGLLQTPHDGFGRVLTGPGGEGGIEVINMVQAVHESAKTGFAGPRGITHNTAQRGPFCLGKDGNGAPTLLALTSSDTPRRA